MVITTLGWLALGLLGAGAVAAIITYWDEIVKWARDIFDSIFSRGKMFLKWVSGYLESWINGITKNGKGEVKSGPTRPATEEEIRQLYEEGIITYQEMIDLLNGKTISTSVA